MSLTLIVFEKTITSLEVTLNVLHSSTALDETIMKIYRDACIQRFEYSIEMAWKISMKFLGSQTMAAKPAIREMARNNLITNPDLWLSFIDARNETSHSYEEDVAIRVLQKIELFFPEAQKLILKLKTL